MNKNRKQVYAPIRLLQMRGEQVVLKSDIHDIERFRSRVKVAARYLGFRTITHKMRGNKLEVTRMARIRT